MLSFYSIFSMEFKDLDDDSPIRSQLIFLPIIYHENSCNNTEELDNCEFLTKLPNTEKYVALAQKEIRKSKQKRN